MSTEALSRKDRVSKHMVEKFLLSETDVKFLLQSLEGNLDEISGRSVDALNKRHWEVLAACGHSLCGISHNTGQDDLLQVGTVLEQAAKAQEHEKATKAVQFLAKIIHELRGK